MILRTLIIPAFISTLFACNSNSSSTTTSVKVDNTSERLNTENQVQKGVHTNTHEQYANIIRIWQKGDTTFLEVDYIQYLTGDAAIVAAKKVHQADTFQTQDGKIHIDVPNDYFIVNESKKIRLFSLANDCAFDLNINPDRKHPITNNSLKSLQTIYSDSPFILTLNDKDFIIKVKEVFTP